MKRRLLHLLTTLALAGANWLPAQAADPSERREALRERVQDMTPAQESQVRGEARARWDVMTPEQQEVARQQWAERAVRQRAT